MGLAGTQDSIYIFLAILPPNYIISTTKNPKPIFLSNSAVANLSDFSIPVSSFLLVSHCYSSQNQTKSCFPRLTTMARPLPPSFELEIAQAVNLRLGIDFLTQLRDTLENCVAEIYGSSQGLLFEIISSGKVAAAVIFWGENLTNEEFLMKNVDFKKLNETLKSLDPFVSLVIQPKPVNVLEAQFQVELRGQFEAIITLEHEDFGDQQPAKEFPWQFVSPNHLRIILRAEVLRDALKKLTEMEYSRALKGKLTNADQHDSKKEEVSVTDNWLTTSVHFYVDYPSITLAYGKAAHGFKEEEIVVLAAPHRMVQNHMLSFNIFSLFDLLQVAADWNFEDVELGFESGFARVAKVFLFETCESSV